MRPCFPEIFAPAPGKKPLDRGGTLCYSIVSKKSHSVKLGEGELSTASWPKNITALTRRMAREQPT